MKSGTAVSTIHDLSMRYTDDGRYGSLPVHDLLIDSRYFIVQTVHYFRLAIAAVVSVNLLLCESGI